MTALVTKHLPLVAAAPDGIKNLRALILQLAVKGKLVSHDPSDESVDQLLARISDARDAYSGKGQGRRSKPTERELEPRFDAPAGWQWVRLGDLLSKIGAGSTPLGGKQAYIASGIKFLRSQNVWNEGLRLDDVALIPKETHEKMSGTHVGAGDILFNITGASIGRCAIVPDSFDTGNVSQHVTIIRPCIPDTCGYLHKVLMSGLVQDTVMAVQVGVSREGLSIGKLAQFPIPLPPLAEQHRIVAKVDELIALCGRLEAHQTDAEAAHAQLVQALLDSLTHATDAADFNASWQRLSEHFHTLFTTEASIDALKQTVLQLAVMGKLVPQSSSDEPASVLLQNIQAGMKGATVAESDVMPLEDNDGQPISLPSGWTWASFGHICAIKTCLVRPEDYLDSQQLAPDCIEKGTGRIIGRRTVRQSGVRGPNSRFAKGQIVYSKIRPSLSKAVLVDFDGLCSADMYPLDSFISSSYQLRLMLSEVFLRQVRLAENRVKMPKLNQESLNAFVVPIPPLAEQHRIVAKVDELMALCDQLKLQLAEARQQHAQLAMTLVEQAVA